MSAVHFAFSSDRTFTWCMRDPQGATPADTERARFVNGDPTSNWTPYPLGVTCRTCIRAMLRPDGIADGWAAFIAEHQPA